MLYFLYWLGILVLLFGTISFIKVSKIEDDELPAPKEQLNAVIIIITVIGSLLITVSLPFINYKNKVENKIRIQLNEKL